MDEEPVVKRQSTFPLFSKYFSAHPQDVIEYFQSMRKQMEDFIEAFRKRIQVEITYSKNLQQVSKSLDKYIKPGTQLSTSYICSAFKVQHQQRSRQALELAESLKTEIETMCSEYLKNQSATLKKMEKDIKKFYKDCENYSENHSRALDSFQSINKQMQQTIITKNIMRYTTGIPQQKKVKLIGKATESIKENKQYERLYLNAVKQYNLFVGAYNKEITTQLDQAENLIREQVIMQGDCLRKLIVAEVSMFKNIQYDLLNISKQMEHLDTQKDVESFVEEQKNNVTNKIIFEDKKDKDEDVKRASLTSLDNLPVLVLEEKKILGKSMLSESIFYIEEEYFSWMLSNKRNKKLRQIVGRMWRILKNDRATEKTAQKSQISEPQQGAPQGQNAEVKVQQPKSQATAVIAQSQVANSNGQSAKPWSEELKQTIANFKILNPPNFLVPAEKKQKNSNANYLEKIYDNYIEITSIIALLWNSEQIDPQTLNNKLSILEGYMSEHHLYRLIALIFIEEYRLQHEVVIKSSNNAKVCGKIIRTVLKESQKRNDVFIIKGLLGLVFTFYWIEDKIKKLIYQIPQIYQCEIWKKTDFWQAAIFQTTFEEMSLFAVQKGQTQAETNLREKNIIFSQLASYCHYMVMLGITSKNVRLTVGRYCRLYDMTEEQNKDLSKMINNTLKQYKEMAGKGQKEKSVIGD